MKGYITKEQLSDSLKEYLQTLGLTQEQVNTVITRVSGDLSLLETTAKDSLVNAINENKTSILELQNEVNGVRENLINSCNEIIDML